MFARTSVAALGVSRTRVLAPPTQRIVCGARSYLTSVGALDKNSQNVGTGLVGKASWGDVIKLQVKVEDGVIRDAECKTLGCGFTNASCSLAAEMIIGKPIDEAETISNWDISTHLKLPNKKIHCSVLAEAAIQGAIKDYKAKQTTAKAE